MYYGECEDGMATEDCIDECDKAANKMEKDANDSHEAQSSSQDSPVHDVWLTMLSSRAPQ